MYTGYSKSELQAEIADIGKRFAAGYTNDKQRKVQIAHCISELRKLGEISEADKVQKAHGISEAEIKAVTR